MTENAHTRQEHILRWLAEAGGQRIAIDDLAARLGVSLMTIHRDLDALARRGLARKLHGAAVAAEPKARATSSPACDLCDVPIAARLAFTVQLADGETLHACCPHCGLLLLRDLGAPISILTRDFLYGRTLNAAQGSYLLESSVAPCCLPGVLCFASGEDAERFRQGFGGWIADFAAARRHLDERHAAIPH